MRTIDFTRLLLLVLSIINIANGTPPLYIDCPARLRSHPYCTCSLLQLEKVGIFCDGAESLDAVVNEILRPYQHPFTIDTLHIKNTPIPKLQFNAFGNLNIRHLLLSNNSLVAVDDDGGGSFSSPILDSLEVLTIEHNYQLEVLPTAGFSQLKRLKSLSVTNCMIKELVDYTFLHYHSRQSIESLDLSANILKELTPGALLGLESLKRLNLDKNLFEQLPSMALKEVSATLEELNLSVNQITELEEGQLQLPSLHSLSLDVNRISQIPADAFKDVPLLFNLYLSNNAFSSEIDPSMFYHLPQLKTLSMSNNMITSLGQQTFQHLPSLLSFELNHCFISEIDPLTFRAIPKAQSISLAGNRLRRINHRLFSALPYTVSIDLSNNMISSIDDFAFSNIPSLQFLDLSGNQLEHLEPNIFYNTFSHQSVVDLHDNPWECDSRLVWLIDWLKGRKDIQVSSSARCAMPSDLKGLSLRAVDQLKMTTIHNNNNEIIVQHKWSKAVNGTTLKAPPPQSRQPISIAKTNVQSMIFVISIICVGCLAIVFVFVKVVVLKQRRGAFSKQWTRDQPNHFSSSNKSRTIFHLPTPMITDQSSPPQSNYDSWRRQLNYTATGMYYAGDDIGVVPPPPQARMVETHWKF